MANEDLFEELRSLRSTPIELAEPSSQKEEPVSPNEDLFEELRSLRTASVPPTEEEVKEPRSPGEALWARTGGRFAESGKQLYKSSMKLLEEPSWEEAGKAGLSALEVGGSALAPLGTAVAGVAGTGAEQAAKLYGAEDPERVGDIAEMITSVGPGVAKLARKGGQLIRDYHRGGDVIKELYQPDIEALEESYKAMKKSTKTLEGKVAVGERLAAPGVGANLAIKRVGTRSKKLFRTAQKEAAEAKLVALKNNGIVNTIDQAKREAEVGGVLGAYGRGPGGKAFPENIEKTLNGITTVMNKHNGQPPVSVLMSQQFRLRHWMRKLPSDHPGKIALSEVDKAIDTAIMKAAKGTPVYKKLQDARDYYRTVKLPTEKTAIKLLKAETPEQRVEMLTKGKPSRMTRIGEAGQVSKDIQKVFFDDLIVAAAKEGGGYDLAALSKSLTEANKSGLLHIMLGGKRSAGTRLLAIRAIHDAAKLQRRLQAGVSVVGAGGGGAIGFQHGAAGMILGILAGGSAATFLSDLMTDKKISGALLRYAHAKQFTPSVSKIEKMFTKRYALPPFAVGAYQFEGEE